MADWCLNTPVAFLIFNRPETTERVFARIARARPPVLLVVADGPRPNEPDDKANCAAARAIIERVDWDCKLMTNYSISNMGCKVRISSGLDWVFSNVEEAIILEDDCLPDLTFFRFCEEMLTQYRNDERIGQIGGTNFRSNVRRTEASYYFSKYNHIWGWATWRRAWETYDINLTKWPEMRDGGWLKDILRDPNAVKYWDRIFNSVKQGEVDTCWDYQWTYTSWLNGRLTIVPAVNLISNIGFGPAATHTKQVNALANVPLQEMKFPLINPLGVLCDVQADAWTSRHVFGINMLSSFKHQLRKFPGMQAIIDFIRSQ